jgi:hypothetical protein
MLKIGITLKDLSASEKNFCFMSQLSDMCESAQIDGTIFYQNLERACVNPLLTGLMPLASIYGFHNGILITTDIDTTLFAVKAPISSKIIFYMDDIEWMRHGKQNYVYNLNAYKSKFCTVVCKSEDYARYLYNYANIKASVVSGYNIKGILEHGYFKNNSVVR